MKLLKALRKDNAGYDLKHGSHCLRLMRMCKEILSGQGVIVDRRGIDAEQLIAIKMHGVMKYDDLIAEVEMLKIVAAQFCAERKTITRDASQGNTQQHLTHATPVKW